MTFHISCDIQNILTSKKLHTSLLTNVNFPLIVCVCSDPTLPFAVNPKTSWLMTKLCSSASITCRYGSFSLTVKQLGLYFLCMCCLCFRPLASFSVHWKIRYILVVWSGISLNQQASSDVASMVSHKWRSDEGSWDESARCYRY